jgi:hypothetical protein
MKHCGLRNLQLTNKTNYHASQIDGKCSMKFPISFLKKSKIQKTFIVSNEKDVQQKTNSNHHLHT